jgi:hypothetical protein
MVFEYFERSVEDLLQKFQEKQEFLAENILCKILKFGMQAFTCCKDAKMHYPSFSFQNLFVVNPASEQKPGLEQKTSGLSREVKFMHPFLVKSFFYQIEKKHNGGQVGNKQCKCFFYLLILVYVFG